MFGQDKEPAEASGVERRRRERNHRFGILSFIGNNNLSPPSRRPSPRTQIQRVDFGRVSVFLGENNGKYPDGNQVLIRGSDICAAFDTPIVSNYIGPEFDATELGSGLID